MECVPELKPFSRDRVYLMETQVEMETGPIYSRGDTQSVRRRPWGSRRRTRSTGSLPFFWHQKHSDDSSSSIGPDNKGISSMYQSDSDDVSGMQPTMFNLQSRKPSHLLGNLESDSVNENFSPIRPNTRRKRKFKRMAVDVEMASTSSRPPVCFMSASGKKKRVFRHIPNCDNRFCRGIAGATCGKRKRSVRTDSHRNMNVDPPQVFSSPLDTATPTTALHRLSIRDPQPPVSTAEIPSNSSLSSSESDTGIFTNDEGREGDDEQSDWFGEAGAVGGTATGGKGWWEDSDRDEDMEPTFQALLTGSLDQMSDRAKRTYRMLADRMGHGGREIRGGRRRVRAEKPGFSVLTSANEKLSRFLQDPAQSELRLHPMQKREREQLCHLADLYSLNMSLAEPSKKGLTCPVLTKTSNTVQVEHVSLARFNTLSDFKRRRKAAPSGHFSSPPGVSIQRLPHVHSKASQQATISCSTSSRTVPGHPQPKLSSAPQLGTSLSIQAENAPISTPHPLQVGESLRWK